MISNIYVYVVCVVYVVNVVYLVNVGKVRFTRFTRFTLYTPGGLVNLGVNVGLYRFTACPYAGYLSFLFDRAGVPGSQDHRKDAVKLARFLHGLGVEKVTNWLQNSLIMVTDNYAKSIYHNHDIQIPQKTRKKHNFQMINDLQRRFENADNFSVV